MVTASEEKLVQLRNRKTSSKSVSSFSGFPLDKSEGNSEKATGDTFKKYSSKLDTKFPGFLAVTGRVG